MKRQQSAGVSDYQLDSPLRVITRQSVWEDIVDAPLAEWHSTLATYELLSLASDAGVPDSTTRPASRTIRRSIDMTVIMRCAIVIVVLPAQRAMSLRCNAASERVSSEDVASSKRVMAQLRSSTRARQICSTVSQWVGPGQVESP